MLRVSVIAHRAVMDDITTALQRAGVLEVTQAPIEELSSAQLPTDDKRLRSAQEHLAQMQFVCEFLSRYHVNEQPFSTFISEKFHVERDRYHALEFGAHHGRLYHECVNLSDRIAHNERELERLRQLVSALEPWSALRLQISEWKGTEHTALFTGTVPASEAEDIRARLRDEVADVTVEQLGSVGAEQAWVVIAHRSCVDAVRGVLAFTRFTEVSFPGLHDYPAEEISRALYAMAQIERDSDEAGERASSLAKTDYHEAVTLLAALESGYGRLAVRANFATTDAAFVIEGWVPAEGAPALEAALALLGDDVDLTLSDPGPDDEPPVKLVNPPWLQPFEILTDLYGRPRYRDADPTPVLAPFFLLFFAICIGDFGYGAMLAVGAWVIKTKLDVAPGVKKFMDLLILGGLGSMVVGVALGGYLALPVDSLPQVLQDLQVLDPIADIQLFLVVALVIGVIQVFFGVILAAAHAFQRGDADSAIFDHISVFVLFGSVAAMVVTGQMVFLVGGLVLTMAMQGRALTRALGAPEAPAWDRALGWLWLASAVWFVAAFALGGVNIALAAFLVLSIGGPFFSPTVRAAVFGLLGGAYSVYGMTGYVGDVLSYLRLTALGLSGALVGWVFNILAGLVWETAAPLWASGGFAWVGAALVMVGAILVFTVGHVFNVVINLLGAFVHPARLQFVEFFSKFYEAGGRPYEPFAYQTENLVLGTSGAEKEGGSS